MRLRGSRRRRRRRRRRRCWNSSEQAESRPEGGVRSLLTSQRQVLSSVSHFSDIHPINKLQKCRTFPRKQPATIRREGAQTIRAEQTFASGLRPPSPDCPHMLHWQPDFVDRKPACPECWREGRNRHQSKGMKASHQRYLEKQYCLFPQQPVKVQAERNTNQTILRQQKQAGKHRHQSCLWCLRQTHPVAGVWTTTPRGG